MCTRLIQLEQNTSFCKQNNSWDLVISFGWARLWEKVKKADLIGLNILMNHFLFLKSSSLFSFSACHTMSTILFLLFTGILSGILDIHINHLTQITHSYKWMRCSYLFTKQLYWGKCVFNMLCCFWAVMHQVLYLHRKSSSWPWALNEFASWLCLDEGHNLILIRIYSKMISDMRKGIEKFPWRIIGVMETPNDDVNMSSFFWNQPSILSSYKFSLLTSVQVWTVCDKIILNMERKHV